MRSWPSFMKVSSALAVAALLIAGGFAGYKRGVRLHKQQQPILHQEALPWKPRQRHLNNLRLQSVSRSR